MLINWLKNFLSHNILEENAKVMIFMLEIIHNT